jgi:hypothetical protein
MSVSDENLDAVMTGLRLAYANQEADYSPLGTTEPSDTRGKLQTLDSGTANLKDATDAALNCA